MCGINGFTRQDENLIKQMNAEIKHRGPDSDGFFVNEKISLGHVRLAIIDLSAMGHQPMTYKHLTITFNGEIYNFKDIKEELKQLGHSFKSETDTEMILAAYNEWGENCLDKFNGMFAFAIWDEIKNELFIARDRLGIKPFYYYHQNNQFIFSSEIKAILKHAHINKNIDCEKLNFIYKMSCLPRELTIYKHIKQLPAAHFGKLKDNKLEIKKYWEITDTENLKNKKEIKKQIKEILEDSVKIRLMSDVPLGVFLSGGIDSSIMVMLANKFSKEPVKTFSIGFEIEQEFEKYNADFFIARKTAKFFNTDHHEIIIKKGQAKEYFNHIAENLEFPNTMSTSVPSFWISKYAKENVSVVLGGDGGDELFGGYDRYRISFLVSFLRKLPLFIKKLIFIKKANLKKRVLFKNNLDQYVDLKFHKDGDWPNVLNKEYFNTDVVKDFLNTNYNATFVNKKDFEKRFMWLDTQTWLVDHSLIRTDKTTMFYGLEERVPFLDHRLVELAQKIPTRYKIGLFNTKKILKETFKDDLPNFLFKQPKRGWLSPAAKWLREELKDLSREVLADDYVKESKEIFNLVKVRELLKLHIDGKRYNLQLLWLLITWQMWYKKHIQKTK